MVGRFLRVSGSALVIAVAFVTPVLATATATPASADTVLDGCTVVSNPTPTHFTNCPNANLSGAALPGVDLSYANLSGASLVGTNLSGANLSHANISQATLAVCSDPSGVPPFSCEATFFNGTRLTGANISHVNTLACGNAAIAADGAPCIDENFANDDLSGANLSNSDLSGGMFSGANLSGANFTGATLSDTIVWTDTPPIHLVTSTLYAVLSGANLTDTLFVPTNQNVTATSDSGAVATWTTPTPITGATPGSCSSASGSTFLLFSTVVTCQVVDGYNNVATGTFVVNVSPTTQFFTRMLVPSASTTVAGSQALDAAATDAPGVTKVQFELTGGTFNQDVVATGTLTWVGWITKWDSTTVPNGAYALQSVATDAANNVSTSTGITVTVNNASPSTLVGLPSNGATVKGAEFLDATASAGVTQVKYELSGGPNNLVDQVISGSTPTYVGWLGGWDTTSVPDGTYALNSVASYAGGVAGTSPTITLTVAN